jgi:hypothetical protein
VPSERSKRGDLGTASINGRKIGSFEFNKKEKAAFELLKTSFIRALMLIHFKSDRQIKMETDISDFAIAGMLL